MLTDADLALMITCDPGRCVGHWYGSCDVCRELQAARAVMVEVRAICGADCLCALCRVFAAYETARGWSSGRLVDE